MNGDPLTLIGTPYVLESTDPAVGLDCWTLVDYVRREMFGLKTPYVMPQNHLTPSAMRAIERTRELGVWEEVAQPGAPGDVVGMSISVRGGFHHVGIALPLGVLHAWCGSVTPGVGSVVLTPWGRASLQFKQLGVYRCRI